MHVAIFPRSVSMERMGDSQDRPQLLAYGPSSFSRTLDLQPDDFNQVGDTAHIISIILLASEPIDLNGNGRVRLLLKSRTSGC